jgi:hypothetical protein
LSLFFSCLLWSLRDGTLILGHFIVFIYGEHFPFLVPMESCLALEVFLVFCLCSFFYFNWLPIYSPLSLISLYISHFSFYFPVSSAFFCSFTRSYLLLSRVFLNILFVRALSLTSSFVICFSPWSFIQFVLFVASLFLF